MTRRPPTGTGFRRMRPPVSEAAPVSGLTDSEARKRLDRYGPNVVADRGGRSAWRALLAQFTGVLTLVLFAAAVLSVFLGDLLDAGAILAIVVLNAALGFFQEHRAEQSMAALKRMAAPVVRVRRDGRVQEISARALVPGDVVLLETGNVVPADARLLQGTTLRVQEAALTGESEAVEKDAGLVFETARALGDRRNMVYSGTVVSYGHGEGIVTATGMATELGKVADLLQSVEQEQTPLQKRLDQLGRQLAAAALVLVIVVFALGVLRGEPWREMLLVAVSLAVAAIPEALTAVVTIALSLGAQRMLKRRALIRRLPAVETLGSVQVICSDKTGTLTQNRMTVTALDMAAGRVQFAQRPERSGLCLAVTEAAPGDRAGAAEPRPAADRRSPLQRRRAPARRGRGGQRIARSAIPPKERWWWRRLASASSRTTSTGPFRESRSCRSTRCASA